MKTLLKAALIGSVFVLSAVGWKAWRSEKVGRDTRQAVGSVKGAVNEELIRTAEKLADRLRAVQRTAETNKEIKQ